MTTRRVQFGIMRPGVSWVVLSVGQRFRACLSQARFYALAPTSRQDWTSRPGSTRGSRFEYQVRTSIDQGENRVKLPKKPLCCQFERVSSRTADPANGSRTLEPSFCRDGHWPPRPKTGLRVTVLAPVLPDDGEKWGSSV